MKKKLFLIGVIIMLSMLILACGEKTHTHTFGDWIVTKDATCETNGEETRVCSLDSTHKETRVISAKGHKYGEWNVTISATCETNGEETRVCSLDNNHKEVRTISALGHKFGDFKLTTSPSCLVAGEETRICERDGNHKEVREITPLGHTLGEWEIKVPATCTLEGEKVKKCTVCSVVMETQIVEPLGHKYGEWVVTTPPTTTEFGEETRVCQNNNLHKETRPLAKLPIITEDIFVVNGNVINATDKVDSTIQLNVNIKYIGESSRIATCDDVTFVSNNHLVATVDKNGLITIKAPGSVEIYVESIYSNESGVKVRKTITLNVKHSPITELNLLTRDSYSMVRGLSDSTQSIIGDKAQIGLSLKYYEFALTGATSADVTFASNDENVASADENGLISFNGLGACIITITSKHEQQNGGYMTKTVDVDVKMPINNTGLEVIDFVVGQEGNEPTLDYTIKNTTNKIINTRIADIYYLDASGKILGTDTLLIFSSMIALDIQPGEEVSNGYRGRKLPEGTSKLFIFNIKVT